MPTPNHKCCGHLAMPNDWAATCRTCGKMGCVHCMAIKDLLCLHQTCPDVRGPKMINAKKPCAKCEGKGVLEDQNNERCSRCGGSGKEPSPPMNERMGHATQPQG